MEQRNLGTTDIQVSPVALGCWPLSGMTSLEVTEAESVATIRACFEAGVNFLDTAYMYGAKGESETLIARAIAGRRDEMVIATKAGLHWENGQRAHDARPETLRRQCDESLRRLNTDRLELLYLHAPDPNLPIAETARGFRELLQAGKVRAIGGSNMTVAQLEEFVAVCPLAAYQPKYNLLQREIEADILPWCRAHQVSVCVYWPLLKGLLAGKLPRDHVFQPGDGRAKYSMFQGDEWERNQDFVDVLREIARDAGRTVAQVAINWVIHREGITAALCGAKRPDQLRENAGAMGWKLNANQLARIDQALAICGRPPAMNAI